MGETEDLLREALEALKEAEDTFALVERPAFVDPQYGDIVRALGDLIGYGALMSSASASWRQKDLRGGEFVVGPCRATVVSTLAIICDARAKLEAALSPNPERAPLVEGEG